MALLLLVLVSGRVLQYCCFRSPWLGVRVACSNPELLLQEVAAELQACCYCIHTQMLLAPPAPTLQVSAMVSTCDAAQKLNSNTKRPDPKTPQAKAPEPSKPTAEECVDLLWRTRTSKRLRQTLINQATQPGLLGQPKNKLLNGQKPVATAQVEAEASKHKEKHSDSPSYKGASHHYSGDHHPAAHGNKKHHDKHDSPHPYHQPYEPYGGNGYYQEPYGQEYPLGYPSPPPSNGVVYEEDTTLFVDGSASPGRPDLSRLVELSLQDPQQPSHGPLTPVRQRPCAPWCRASLAAGSSLWVLPRKPG